MCNINFVKAKNNKDSMKVSNLMNVMSAVSFKGNSDGDGIVGFKENKEIYGQVV